MSNKAVVGKVENASTEAEDVIITHIARGLTESGAVDAVNATWSALGRNEIEQAKGCLQGLGNWMEEILERAAKIQAKKNAAAAAARVKAYKRTLKNTDRLKSKLFNKGYMLIEDVKGEPVLERVIE